LWLSLWLVLVLVQVCTNGLGTCTAGTDLTVCGASLEYQCGTSNLIKQMMLDECGGHASPYHFHTGLAAACEWLCLWRCALGQCSCVADLKCEYPYNSSATGHSQLIGACVCVRCCCCLSWRRRRRC